MTMDHLPTRFEEPTAPAWQASGTGYAVGRAAAGESDWLDEIGRYLRAVRRNKWLVLGTTLLCAGAGIVLARVKLQPTFIARASVWIQVPSAHVAREPGPIWSGQLPRSSGWEELVGPTSCSKTSCGGGGSTSTTRTQPTPTCSPRSTSSSACVRARTGW